MEKIELFNVLPEIFTSQESKIKELEGKDIWRKDVKFSRTESYLIQASSGDGKSSLCSYLYGYRNDFSGQVLFDNVDINSFGARKWAEVRKSSISILFQDLRLFTELTVMENIALKNSLTHHKTRGEIKALLGELGVEDKRAAKVGHLSFGQQQRVAFIRSLCQPFDFIVLDEPVSHLDSNNAQIMSQILQCEIKERGAGVIVTSVGNNLEFPYSKRLVL